jgi:hypothetical protein
MQQNKILIVRWIIFISLEMEMILCHQSFLSTPYTWKNKKINKIKIIIEILMGKESERLDQKRKEKKKE